MVKARHRTQIITDEVAAEGRRSGEALQDGVGDEPGVATAMGRCVVTGREDVSGQRQAAMVLCSGRHNR